jgi:hypothetical protein
MKLVNFLRAAVKDQGAPAVLESLTNGELWARFQDAAAGDDLLQVNDEPNEPLLQQCSVLTC